MDLRSRLTGALGRLFGLRAGGGGALRRVAGRLAAVERLPTEARATFGHYAAGGRLDVAALRRQPSVEDRVATMVDEAFEAVEVALAERCDVAPERVEFEYETKLLLPVELTLARLVRDVQRRAAGGFDPFERRLAPGLGGRLFRAVGLDGGDPEVAPEFSSLAREAERIERVTRLVVVALIDGDMRDAVNDAEYDDFEATVEGEPAAERPELSAERVATVAQSTLESVVEDRFERFPDAVRVAYDRAVTASEAHQERDSEYRELLAGAEEGDDDAVEGIRERYRGATFEDPPAGYADTDLALPYFRTQYGRVGVIYDGMFEMYEAAGIRVDETFRRAVVLTIVFAQVWLDDVDDYAADAREGQLTPVTGEYVLADDEREGYRRVREVADEYAARAREYAAESGSPLVGIAVEYVTRSGDPTVLPGANGGAD